MNWAQQELYEFLWYCNVVLKARQLGITTFMQILMLDECLFHGNTKAGTIAHTLDAAGVIFRDKIKYPYDNMNPSIKAALPKVVNDNASELRFDNGSSIRVGTSMRSGTLNFLHISELGKIAAKYPERSREIRTGSLNTLQAGQVAVIESTAEGEEGDFFDFADNAQIHARLEKPYTPLDWKFHFFPWWKDPDYRIDGVTGEVFDKEMTDYFTLLRTKHGIKLDYAQKLWYVKKRATQLDDMAREYPSTPEEAFKASVDGNYYGRQMAEAELQKRIGFFPAVKGIAVHTGWDIGHHDYTTIWFWQKVFGKIRVVGYYENHGKVSSFYVKVCRDLYAENGWSREGAIDWFPHDAKVTEWTGTGNTRLENLAGEGLNPKIPQAMGKEDGINAVRLLLPICEFDEVPTKDGVKRLKQYKKEWDDNRSVFLNIPAHNDASHGADGFRTVAMAYRTPEEPETDAERNAREIHEAREARLREATQARRNY